MDGLAILEAEVLRKDFCFENISRRLFNYFQPDV